MVKEPFFSSRVLIQSEPEPPLLIKNSKNYKNTLSKYVQSCLTVLAVTNMN